MYQLDSGLLGIILTLLLIAFNFYVSYRKKKRQQIKRKDFPVVNTESSAGKPGDMKNPYEAKSGMEPVEEQEKNNGGLKDIFKEIEETINVPQEDDEGLFDFFFNKSQDKSGSGGAVVGQEPGTEKDANKMEREGKMTRSYEFMREKSGEQSPMSATDPDQIAYVAFDEVYTEPVYNNGLESIENTGGISRFASIGHQGECDPVVCDSVEDLQEETAAVASGGKRSKKPDLKRRLKSNPRDLILFSELLKPRYKDF